MINFDDFLFNKDLIPKDNIEKEKYFKEYEEKFYNEIVNSEKAREYLSRFNSNTVDSFIKSYVSRKIELAKSYEYFNYIFKENEENELSYHKNAEIAMMAIQQKKLFNLQLQWRANLLKIDGIDICFDFQFWEKHIESCPFISPVEEFEKDMMKEYLLNNDDFENEISDVLFPSWQDYDDLMRKDNDGLYENMLDWYEYFDLKMGTNNLLLLPDLKGEKEEFYMDINRKSQNVGKVKSKKIDNRPIIIGYGEDLINFAKFYESDKHFLQLFKSYELDFIKKDSFPFPENIEMAIQVLSTADRPVYFPSNLNWDLAIIFAANKYSNIKTAEALDVVYDEYKMLRELGMTTTESSDEIANAYEKDEIVKLYRTAILNGRVLNGESADFNY